MGYLFINSLSLIYKPSCSIVNRLSLQIRLFNYLHTYLLCRYLNKVCENFIRNFFMQQVSSVFLSQSFRLPLPLLLACCTSSCLLLNPMTEVDKISLDHKLLLLPQHDNVFWLCNCAAAALLLPLLLCATKYAVHKIYKFIKNNRQQQPQQTGEFIFIIIGRRRQQQKYQLWQIKIVAVVAAAHKTQQQQQQQHGKCRHVCRVHTHTHLHTNTLAMQIKCCRRKK